MTKKPKHRPDLTEFLAAARLEFNKPRRKSKQHPNDYTALSNWQIHDEVRDSEISRLVVRLADHGMRVAEIENIMKEVLKEKLKMLEMVENEEDMPKESKMS
ncbi:hypothetical protein ACI2JN_24975 [Ochrobactrum teleogrylli]|uniref:hypothetical protein n=1 Tax=Ochrobactrum teleogrylli TaxID=2479765 RepID=UPI00384F8364